MNYILQKDFCGQKAGDKLIHTISSDNGESLYAFGNLIISPYFPKSFLDKHPDCFKPEEHTCKHCGAKTSQPDSECYKVNTMQYLDEKYNLLSYKSEHKERELRNQIETLQLEKSNLKQLLYLTEQASNFKDTIIEDLRKKES